MYRSQQKVEHRQSVLKPPASPSPHRGPRFLVALTPPGLKGKTGFECPDWVKEYCDAFKAAEPLAAMSPQGVVCGKRSTAGSAAWGLF